MMMGMKNRQAMVKDVWNGGRLEAEVHSRL
jgi:hypothetical protein